MLRRIKIDRLYDLYSYELNFENEDHSPMKFLTGPNGYGKSTMLNMVYAVFTHDCKKLFDIPFASFVMYFNDAEVQFTQTREYRQGDKSDLENLEKQTLHVVYTPTKGKKEEGDIALGEGCNMPNLEMFLAEQNAYYIDDKRVIHNTIDANSEKIIDIIARLNTDAKLLEEKIWDHQIDLSSPSLSIGEYISEEEYRDKLASMSKELDLLKEWGLVNENFAPLKYLDGLGDFMRRYLEDLDKKIHAHNDFVDLLKLFKGLVEESFFANKTLRIGKDVGFLFYSESEYKEPLLPEKLSSGERHLLLQLFELIFRAPKGALVLIDEPELSMHMYWQLRYSDVLSRIAEARNLHFIVATHSPQIFNSMWSRSVDLYELVKGN